MPDSCVSCSHWRHQSGSAHVLCPVSPDFRLIEGVRCGLYKEDDGNTDRRCNAFLVWSGKEWPAGWPSK